MSHYSGKRILLTGASSLIGSFLAERLIEQGAMVRGTVRERSPIPSDLSASIEWVEGDLRDASFVQSIIQGVDEVYHAASHRRNVAYHREHRDEVVADNAAMTENLIRALGTNKIPVTFFSTAIVGTMDANTAVDSIQDGYVAGKILCEKAWTEAAARVGFPLLMVRPVSAYGPRDRFAEDGNVIPALMVRAEKATQELTVWGSGMQLRSFVYAPDVADAVMVLRHAKATGVQPLCPPELVTIGALAVMVRDLVHPGLLIRFNASKPDGPSFPAFPVHASLQSFPWTRLEEGLRLTLDWHRSVR